MNPAERVARWTERTRARYPWVDQAHELAVHDRGAAGSLLAAALAARIFLWLLPCALLLMSVLGFLGADRETLNRLAGELHLTDSVRQEIATAAGQAEPARFVTATLGVFLFVLAGLALGRTMDQVVARLWGVPSRRGVGARLKRAARCSGVLIGVLFVHAVAVALRPTAVPALVITAGTLLSFALLAMVLLAVQSAPARGHRLPGALVLACGLEAMRLVGFYYLPVKLEHSIQLYGVLGLAAAALLWLTIVARLIVLGHAVNVRAADRRAAPGITQG